jgi:hypothetical protein
LTGEFELPGRSGAVFDPARTALAPAMSVNSLRKFFMVLYQ